MRLVKVLEGVFLVVHVVHVVFLILSGFPGWFGLRLVVFGWSQLFELDGMCFMVFLFGFGCFGLFSIF